MAEPIRVREISNEEGNRLLRAVRRSSGSIVTWRRSQMVLLSAQGMDPSQIARVTFTSPDRVREVIRNFNADGFDALYPRYRGGRPPKHSEAERAEIKRIALARPTDHDLPFSTWSLTKLAEHLVEREVVEDISHEGLRKLLDAEGVSFQRIKTWKQSTDPDFESRKERVLELYEIADGKRDPGPGEASEVICLDEFGPLNLQPRPGRQWASRSRRRRGEHERGRKPRRRLRATFNRTQGVRHLFAAFDLRADRLYGHVKTRKRRGEFLEFLRYVRSLHPLETRIAIVLDNFSPHLTTKLDQRVGEFAAASNIELAYVPTNASWLNRIEPQLTGLRYFALDGTDHRSHAEQGRMIRRYISWRNRNACNPHLRRVIERANVC